MKKHPFFSDKIQPNGNVAFFLRHQNDCEFILPLMFTGVVPHIITYGPNVLTDANESVVRRAGFSIFDIYRARPTIRLKILEFLNKACRRLSLLSGAEFFLSSHSSLVNKAYERALVSPGIKEMLQECVSVVFDHSESSDVRGLVATLRRQFRLLDLKIISVPHGAYIFENRMLDETVIKPPKELDLRFFDLVVCDDGSQSEGFLGNKAIIRNLRYSQEWISFRNEVSLSPSARPKKAADMVRVLVLLSKYIGGVSEHNVIRALRILGQFSNIFLIVKPHPRGAEEVERLKTKGFTFGTTEGSILEEVEKADAVCFFQSSAVLDAIMLEKQIIFPAFATANRLNHNILRVCNVAETPDELYSLGLKLSNNEQLKSATPPISQLGPVLDAWRAALLDR